MVSSTNARARVRAGHHGGSGERRGLLDVAREPAPLQRAAVEARQRPTCARDVDGPELHGPGGVRKGRRAVRAPARGAQPGERDEPHPAPPARPSARARLNAEGRRADARGCARACVSVPVHTQPTPPAAGARPASERLPRATASWHDRCPPG
eukprot:4937137-Prymnesium_polylepis.1